MVLWICLVSYCGFMHHEGTVLTIVLETACTWVLCNRTEIIRRTYLQLRVKTIRTHFTMQYHIWTSHEEVL
jgi:hypothetical protein